MNPKKPRPGNPARRTSLRELARITGFSVTTISMVLNGRAADYAISDETRDLLLAAAREHNYQPSVHARSLRSRTTNLVGLIVPTLKNRFFSEMVEGFETLARNDGKLSLFTVTHYDRSEELRAMNYFLSQNVECIFTANPVALDEVAALCERAQTRHIVLDAPKSSRPTVTTDNVKASRELTACLLASMGERARTARLYFVGGTANHAVTRQRVSGFRAALRERGLRFAEEQFVPTPFDETAAYQALRALLASDAEVGGLFLNSLPPLEGLIRLFAEQPERCRHVHYGVFDYHPLMRLLGDLHLWAVKQDADTMMRTAYGLLAGDGASKPVLHLIPYELVQPGAEAPPAVEPPLRVPAAPKGGVGRPGTGTL
jgi:DNA-binding LacI/PurR family transcriptional regulator